MSISRQNLSAVIVTLKSENVIHECIKSINQNIPIIVVENSNNQRFKEDLESQYKNLKCILSKSNIGMGAGNNIGIKSAKTDYVYILNPDATLESNTLDEIFLASKKIPEFSILSPINVDLNFPNYKKSSKEKYSPFQVEYVDGFSMLLNKKKFEDNIYFDEFYFSKKHFGFLKATMECLPTYISSILKFLFYLLINNNFKKKIYFNRASGFYNALLGKSSWYRPKIDN